MTKVLNLLIVFIMIMVMGCAYAFANEEESQTTAVPVYQQANANPVYHQPSVGLKIVDALFVRIPMIGASSASTSVFIAISPVVYLMGIGEPMARAMVEAPWRFTVARPLGDFTGRTTDGKPIYIRTAW